jgi:hypothetical protein
MVPNQLINDNNLSAKAKGIFVYLLSKPDDWRFYVDEVTSAFKEGKTAVQTGIKELEDYGYLERERLYDMEHKIVSWDWIMKLPTNEEIHQQENLVEGKSTQRKTPPYTNTKSTKTNLTKTDRDIYIHHFDEFWDLYDKKVERKKCERKWKKLSKDDIELILQFVPIYKESVSSKQYQKNPFTFLNSRIWEDDWENYKPKANEAHQQFSERQPSRTDYFSERGRELIEYAEQVRRNPERYNSWQLEGKRTDPYSTG